MKRINPRLVAQKARGFSRSLPRIDEIARRMAPAVSEGTHV